MRARPQFEPSNSDTWVSATFAGQARAIDREAVIHRGDLDLAGREILDRMVGAVMALVHFHGPAAERDAEHLMAEADAEDRQPGIDQRADHRHRIFSGRRRIAGTVGEEHPIRA